MSRRLTRSFATASGAPTGAKLRARDRRDAHELTPQERQIARLAAEGLSNPEIPARLFLSSRTDGGMCARCSGSFGIASRHELPTALPAADA